jgi:hypothetical protein
LRFLVRLLNLSMHLVTYRSPPVREGFPHSRPCVNHLGAMIPSPTTPVTWWSRSVER